jgi:hypothetical protein
MRETRISYKILVEATVGKRLLGGTKRRWEDNINTDPEEIV